VAEQRKIRVAVIFGGRSAEHSVSCASAANLMPAIDRDRYEVIPVGITRDGHWVLTSGDSQQLAMTGGALPSVETAQSAQSAESVAAPVAGTLVAPAVPGATSGAAGLAVTSPGDVPRDLGEVDVVLPLLHGAYGEDGTIQGMLEMSGARYAGAGVFASAAGMDKEYMKLIFAARGLPVGPYVVVRDREWPSTPGESLASAQPADAGGRKRVLDQIEELGWPVFVKPARGGSSVGTSRAADLAELEHAIETARRYDPKVLVEAAVEGMEIECAVLEGIDGGPPDASIPGQVMVGGDADFYDFDAKYLTDDTSMVIPPLIPAARIAEIRQLACAAFEAISCEGLARVDFFYTPDGEIIVNEINTMPGMTLASGFPKMWEATGLPLPRLVDRIIQTALTRRPGLR
jgi:D-alanine-D-alanine ligase